MRLVAVLHNVSSIQRLVDFARAAYSLGVDALVVTKAYGAAAQHGIAEVGRIAYKAGRGFVVLPDLSDVVELVKPDRLLIVTLEHARERLDPASPPSLSGVVAVAFNGGEPDFTQAEAQLGEPLYIKGVEERLGAVAEAGVVLYALKAGGAGSG